MTGKARRVQFGLLRWSKQVALQPIFFTNPAFSRNMRPLSQNERPSSTNTPPARIALWATSNQEGLESDSWPTPKSAQKVCPPNTPPTKVLVRDMAEKARENLRDISKNVRISQHADADAGIPLAIAIAGPNLQYFNPKVWKPSN